MLKEKDGKIVVPQRFMEWLRATRNNQSFRIALINRLGWEDSRGERYSLGISLSFNGNSFHGLEDFVLMNQQYLTRALLDKKEFIPDEEKKYYMVAPDGFDVVNKYLNRWIVSENYIMADNSETVSHKTQFTQSEIDAMPQSFRDFFRQVEVEE